MTRLSTMCMDERHDRCVDGAAMYCQCSCHTKRTETAAQRPHPAACDHRRL